MDASATHPALGSLFSFPLGSAHVLILHPTAALVYAFNT